MKGFLVGVLGLLLFMVTACAGAETDGALQPQPLAKAQIADKAEAGTEEKAQDGGEQADPPVDLYQNIYGQVVAESGGEAVVFSLIYLDGDDTPELVACDRENDSFSIYTVKDGSAFCMMDSVRTVELTYFERTGILAQFASWNGGGDEGGYGHCYYQVSVDKTLTEEDLPILRYSYNAIYDEEGAYTGEGTTEYYDMEQGTDETAYREKLKSFGVVEGSGRPCLDPPLGKEEMLERLGKADPFAG